MLTKRHVPTRARVVASLLLLNAIGGGAFCWAQSLPRLPRGILYAGELRQVVRTCSHDECVYSPAAETDIVLVSLEGEQFLPSMAINLIVGTFCPTQKLIDDASSMATWRRGPGQWLVMSLLDPAGFLSMIDACWEGTDEVKVARARFRVSRNQAKIKMSLYTRHSGSEGGFRFVNHIKSILKYTRSAAIP